MQRQKLGNIVLRVQYSSAQSQSQLVAYDLVHKAWYQTPAGTWHTHRELLQGFGVAEVQLQLTDIAFSTGSRDAQFPAVMIAIHQLETAGFTAKIW